jgi:hypothetical protein
MDGKGKERETTRYGLVSTHGTISYQSHCLESRRVFMGLESLQGMKKIHSLDLTVILFNNLPPLERFSACDELEWETRNK